MTTLAVLSLLIWLYLLAAHGRFWQSAPELAPGSGAPISLHLVGHPIGQVERQLVRDREGIELIAAAEVRETLAGLLALEGRFLQAAAEARRGSRLTGAPGRVEQRDVPK